MKKFSLLLAAALCLPLVGLTGCGGSGETQVIQNTTEEPEMSAEEQARMDAEMEAAMNEQGGN